MSHRSSQQHILWHAVSDIMPLLAIHTFTFPALVPNPVAQGKGTATATMYDNWQTHGEAHMP